MDRHNQSGAQSGAATTRGRQVTAKDVANAKDYFEHFLNATSLKNILGYYRSICDLLNLKPNQFLHFYPKLRSHLTSWRAKALWKKFDARAAHKCYGKGKLCTSSRVLIIGAGPCGLRTAIEAQMLGAKVVVIEKRDRLSRNNVLHLWPFVIEDLRMLGAKKFFGKFCAGAIDHISIRQLQCILMKVALLLGVEVHTEVSFERLIEPNPNDKSGWKAEFEPRDHPVAQYEFDVIIGADGKRNTLQGFKRKEFRGKLAIAITANFINKRTEAEARVQEISGVAFIFNQKFFKDLHEVTGIDLENIVYYKDDTHYFVMTAKKPSLIEKGVIKQDLSDTERLLAPDNVNREELMNYAREAANFSTNYEMTDLEFAVNHYGQPDVAMFDFTSMYAAENASKVVERHGFPLLMILVGDSLLEPFWPTGSGCARGFLSSMDAAWAIRSWNSGSNNLLDVLAERESIYRLLAQTTPDNLNKDWKAYTLDPATRYPNLNKNVVVSHQITALYDTDNAKNVDKMRRSVVTATPAPSDVLLPRKRRRENVDSQVLLSWVIGQVRQHDDIVLTDIASIFRNGKTLCAILNRYRPDLFDFSSAVTSDDPVKNNQLAIDILEKEIGITPVMTGEEITKTDDYLTMATYLTEIYDSFRCEIPHIKHPRLTSPPVELPPLPPPPPLPQTLPPPPPPPITFTSTILEKITEEPNDDVSITTATSDISVSYFDTKLRRKLSVFTVNLRPSCQGNNDDDVIRPFTLSEKSYSWNSDDLEVSSSCRGGGEGEAEDVTAQTSLLTVVPRRQVAAAKQVKSYVSESLSGTTLPPPPRQPERVCQKFVSLVGCYRKFHVFRDTRNAIRKSIRRVGTKMVDGEEEAVAKVANWISSQHLPAVGKIGVSDIGATKTVKDNMGIETNLRDGISDITSLTKRLDLIDGKKDNMIIPPADTLSYEGLVLEERTTEVKCVDNVDPLPKLRNDNNWKFVKRLSRFSQYSPFEKNYCTNNAKNANEESKELFELPRTNESNNYKSMKFMPKMAAAVTGSGVIDTVATRPPSRHKRHADAMMGTGGLGAISTVGGVSSSTSGFNNKNNNSSMDRKTRKRRTFEKVGASVEERQKMLEEIAANRTERHQKRRQQRKLQTEQFLKSMQMLQANAQWDNSGPFEDYSIFLYRQTAPNFGDRVKDLEKKFTYVPDRENKPPGNGQTGRGGNTDEDFAARIKNMEDKWTEPTPVDKKPKDLLRAIGKIETSDWNIKEIEKKIKENKLGKSSSSNRDKEKVPKWSKEQFVARQTKMEKQHLDRQNSAEAKYADIDRSIKNLEQKLKEGTTRELGTNKVATITEQLASKVPEKPEDVQIQKSSRPAVMLPTQGGGSEFCHFCGKRVYLMERLSAEGRFFHHGCFKCQYCHTQLRLGSYAFDRDGLYDHKFFCIHHYGMQGEMAAVKTSSKVARRPSQRHATTNNNKSPDKAGGGKQFGRITGVDLLDRVRTPERVEFANLSIGNASSDHEESLSQMDEDEWTDKNFGASTAELGSSDDESSSLSESDSDDEDAYEEALEEPATKEGTLKWAERFKKRYSKKHRNGTDSDEDDFNSSSDQSSYYEENTSDDDESDTATEGEEEIRQRELRKQEVRVEPPVVQTDTGTDTEVVSDESSDSSSEIRNSATEISTDSEFAHDDPTPTREIPSIVFDDMHVTKTRGSRGLAAARRIQVTTGYLQKPAKNGKKSSSPSAIRRSPLADVKLKLTPLVKAAKPQVALPATARNDCNYALNRTQSTGGIAAKVSLELKKRYLLGGAGGAGGGSAIQKSGSASTLDTKFKSFHTNITDCQRLLKKNPTEAEVESVDPNVPDPVGPVEEQKPFENELEGRPRSPVHETSIIVPTIDWSKKTQLIQSEDSLSEDSFKETGNEEIVQVIPSVEVEEIPPDSLCIIAESVASLDSPPKSISSEKKSLNQPKQLPDLSLPELHDYSLHHHHHHGDGAKQTDDVIIISDDDSFRDEQELTAAALTETELSDWARDGAVSSDLDLYSDHMKNDDDRPKKFERIEPIVTEARNPTILTRNLDHIEFMDTGTEETTTTPTTSSEDGVGNSQNGYVLFRNDEDEQGPPLLDSLDPNINEPVTKATPPSINKNTGYCVLFDGNHSDGSNNSGGGEFVDPKAPDSARSLTIAGKSEQDDDSLLIVDGGGTTTEENTCSDSTVKNVTEIGRDDPIDNNNFLRKRMEEKLAKVKAEAVRKQEAGDDFDQHCQRLLSKRIDFGNAKDSIDIRKSSSGRRKSKDSTNQKPDLLICEEPVTPVAMVTLELRPTPRTPDVLYKKEEIEKERDVNQRLVQEMVMSKLKAENKSLERKKRKGTSMMITPTKPYPLMKSATTDVVSDLTPNNRLSSGSSTYATPDIILPTIKKQTPVQPSPGDDNKSDVFATPMTSFRPLSLFASSSTSSVTGSNRVGDCFETPVAPPRLKHEGAKKTAEKLKQDARFRARLLSNEELGLSPEDKLKKLKEKLNLIGSDSNVCGVVKNLDDFHWSVNNDTLSRKRNGSLRRSKSGETGASPITCLKMSPPPSCVKVTAPSSGVSNICKSDPNLLDTDFTDLNSGNKKIPVKNKKPGKDRERRKSLTKFISTLFKKSPNSSGNNGGNSSSTTSKGLFSRKSKDVSKSVVLEEDLTKMARTKSHSELRDKCNSSPPPVPPLPLHYTGAASSTKCTDDSSDGDHEWNLRSSCDNDTVDHILDSSASNLSSTHKKSSRNSSGGAGKRQARQAQLKRHRMAQEIQRKLEETEVKTRELEERGVVVEKALRGEEKNAKFAKEEGELLQEWFDLMRDRTELRRYDKELTVRAQELELEDRHARLQHELREKLENDEQKTEEDVTVEGSIIKEMMEIVAKRDSLIAVLEEDRLRYSTEDRDFEEQMLAKGLILTPVRKSPEK